MTTFQAYTTFSSSFFSTMDKRHHRIFLSVPNVSKRRRFEFFSGAFFFFALLVVCSLSSVFSIFISYVRESYPFLFFYILSNHKKCFISHFRFTFFFFFFFSTSNVIVKCLFFYVWFNNKLKCTVHLLSLVSFCFVLWYLKILICCLLV